MRKIPLKKIAGNGAFVLAGLLLGAMLFFPWETIWGKVLLSASKEMKKTRLSWEEVSAAGPTYAQLREVVIKTQGAEFHIPKLTLLPGVLKLARFKVESPGNQLDVNVKRDGSVSFEGTVDPGDMIGWGAFGSCTAQGEINSPEEADKATGSLEARCSKLNLPGESAMVLENVTLSATLIGNKVNLTKFSLDKPMPVDAQGNLLLVRDRMELSKYSIKGTVDLGGKQQPFSHSGALRDLSKLFSGGIQAFMQ